MSDGHQHASVLKCWLPNQRKTCLFAHYAGQWQPAVSPCVLLGFPSSNRPMITQQQFITKPDAVVYTFRECLSLNIENLQISAHAGRWVFIWNPISSTNKYSWAVSSGNTTQRPESMLDSWWTMSCQILFWWFLAQKDSQWFCGCVLNTMQTSCAVFGSIYSHIFEFFWIIIYR